MLFHVCARAWIHSSLAFTACVHFKSNIHKCMLFTLTHMHAHTPTQTQSQKHLIHWFWWTVCKALPCTDKQKISSDNFSYCLAALALMTGFHLQKRANTAAYVGVGMPLSSPWLNKASRVHQCIFTARLCCALWAEMRTTRLVIYLCREWNLHFSEKNIQLALANEAFVSIRLWYTLGEVQEGESATH